jgi:hypothetical protein
MDLSRSSIDVDDRDGRIMRDIGPLVSRGRPLYGVNPTNGRGFTEDLTKDELGSIRVSTLNALDGSSEDMRRWPRGLLECQSSPRAVDLMCLLTHQSLSFQSTHLTGLMSHYSRAESILLQPL